MECGFWLTSMPRTRPIVADPYLLRPRRAVEAYRGGRRQVRPASGRSKRPGSGPQEAAHFLNKLSPLEYANSTETSRESPIMNFLPKPENGFQRSPLPLNNEEPLCWDRAAPPCLLAATTFGALTGVLVVEIPPPLGLSSSRCGVPSRHRRRRCRPLSPRSSCPCRSIRTRRRWLLGRSGCLWRPGQEQVGPAGAVQGVPAPAPGLHRHVHAGARLSVGQGDG